MLECGCSAHFNSFPISRREVSIFLKIIVDELSSSVANLG